MRPQNRIRKLSETLEFPSAIEHCPSLYSLFYSAEDSNIFAGLHGTVGDTVVSSNVISRPANTSFEDSFTCQRSTHIYDESKSTFSTPLPSDYHLRSLILSEIHLGVYVSFLYRGHNFFLRTNDDWGSVLVYLRAMSVHVSARAPVCVRERRREFRES